MSKGSFTFKTFGNSILTGTQEKVVYVSGSQIWLPFGITLGSH